MEKAVAKSAQRSIIGASKHKPYYLRYWDAFITILLMHNNLRVYLRKNVFNCRGFTDARDSDHSKTCYAGAEAIFLFAYNLAPT